VSRPVPDALAPGGRYRHQLSSLEIGGQARRVSRGDAFPRICRCCAAATPRLRPIGGPIHPSPEEVALNPRARSAVMRVAEKLP
jgi:16S rRNA (cytosine1402-N4)-methyltransferase